jgi:hypothetical protein
MNTRYARWGVINASCARLIIGYAKYECIRTNRGADGIGPGHGRSDG